MSMDLAAIDFAMQYNSLSIVNNLELYSILYRNRGSETYYSYTVPIFGTEGGVNITDIANELRKLSNNFDALADIHTHSADVLSRQIKIGGGKRYSNASLFSAHDIDIYDNNYFFGDGTKNNGWGKPHIGYVVGPNGGLFKYDPAKTYKPNSDYEFSYNNPIFKGAPSDTNTPPSQRLNNNLPNIRPNVLPANFDPTIHRNL